MEIAVALVIFAILAVKIVLFKSEISLLKTEIEVLKTEMAQSNSALSISVKSLEGYVESSVESQKSISAEELHSILDEIKFLKEWVANVGKIATETKDKVESIRG
ncbi:hypothetical protein [Serratia marcescens]|uniref:hypothetical protein n=1 Tax=Serratia marcescens TaxID=615 RepID=UPI0024A71174|nr:hypothetical protein [Serratia marcescens]